MNAWTPLAAGTRFGPYEILTPLGAGGMGEVYRARDERLSRDVAVKVLPAAAATDEANLRRFTEEAQAAGTLNHPNVLAIHDLGTQEGRPYLVSELLEGETLRARMGRGSLSPRKACEYTAQIARGLAAAHEKGIVHRDLKPENLFITRDERLKILDFGLAKLTSDNDALAPTDGTVARTVPGAILGTVGYMSPEQANGDQADPRSDLFALGAVFYEMLAGKRAFEEGSALATLQAVIAREPTELSDLVPEIPRELAVIARRCLEKAPDSRFQSARDLAFHIETAIESTSLVALVPGTPRLGIRRRLPRLAMPTWLRWVLVSVTALVLGFLGGRSQAPSESLPPRIQWLTHSGTDQSPAVSPDGQTLAFVSRRDGQRRLWLKRLASGAEVALVDDASAPRFSPDGSTVLFARKSSLYRVSILGGEPRMTVENAVEGDYSPDGRQIAFIRLTGGGAHLCVVSSDGGGERILRRLEGHVMSNPRFSPDGRRIAVADSSPNTMTSQLVVVNVLDGTEQPIRQPATSGVSRAIAWSGQGSSLVYTRANRSILTASHEVVWHDLDRDRAHPVAFVPMGINRLDVKDDGELALGVVTTRSNLWRFPVDEQATSAPNRLTQGSAVDRQPILSPTGDTPTGETVIFASNRTGDMELWSQGPTGSLQRLTDHPGTDWDALLFDDGRLLWTSDRSGHFELWTAEADGRDPRQLTRDFDAENPSISANGDWILFSSASVEKRGIWKIRPDGTGAVQLITGITGIPVASPDSERFLFLRPRQFETSLHVARLNDGTEEPFTIQCARSSPLIAFGRARWRPDGGAIGLICSDESGTGLFVQDFALGTDTSASRRRLIDVDATGVPESFDFTAEGDEVIVSVIETVFSIAIVDNVSRIQKTRPLPAL